MIKYHETPGDKKIAELADEYIIISKGQDVLDFMGDLVYYDCTMFIIHQRNLHADFFNLKSGLAGDILQKFSNYRVKLAIVGDFSKYESKSLHDFIGECNRGKMIFFVDSVESAILKLAR